MHFPLPPDDDVPLGVLLLDVSLDVVAGVTTGFTTLVLFFDV